MSFIKCLLSMYCWWCHFLSPLGHYCIELYYYISKCKTILVFLEKPLLASGVLCFNWFSCILLGLFKEDFIYFYRGGGREKERERNISVWLPLMYPHWGPGLKSRHVPWLGIEPVTLWFTVQCSMHWATPARAIFRTFDMHYLFILQKNYSNFPHQ